MMRLPIHRWAPAAARFAARLVIATAVVSAFFVVTQDFHIFPGLYDTVFFNRKVTAPADVESLSVTAKDGNRVTVWRLKAPPNEQRSVALLFHGNAEHLDRFVQVQRWLRSIGTTSYAVEYRGYNGRGSGWPSESGFYADADAAYELVQREEKIRPADLIVLGSSIGTGTAAYLAREHQAGTLVLLSPYASLTELVSELPLFGHLVPFVKYRFPTRDYVRGLDGTCVVDAHGKRDGTIPYSHSEQLRALYHGTGTFTLITSEQAGHNDLMAYARVDVEKALLACVVRGAARRS